jgi:hypothetical protein
MKVTVDWSCLRKTKWYEYVVRFIFGGAITAITGIIAKRWGPEVGGLFLAFPAIFPAATTLIEKHEKQKKQRVGLEGTRQGQKAASVDAAGAAIGCIGLLAFAIAVWRFIPTHGTWLVLVGASIAWFATAVVAWKIRQSV